ncbi:MAG TPA: hypothetical protein VK783_16490 [Bacteroidia bacterium]|jgi:hypothetical protein|nr:hypothetical protein [Bacteroidia bacterium]
MIERVREALSCVRNIYLSYPTVGNGSKYGERVFTYEFYHQLRNLFGNDIGFDISGEPVKGNGLIPNFNHTIVPDLVIHNYGDTIHDMVAIEIKTNPNVKTKDICEDLQQLEWMMGAPLNYQDAIFIVANCDFEQKVNLSRRYRNEVNRLKNIQHLHIWNINYPINNANRANTITIPQILNKHLW